MVNAASFIKGAVSPGEIVTLFGTAMGPATAAYATIDPSTGKLATTIGGVQVLFNGTPAPMIYASATQVSAMVPYEMAPIASPHGVGQVRGADFQRVPVDLGDHGARGCSRRTRRAAGRGPS